ncbi:MAG: class I tRNA ligase family protein, partial [Acidobacteria bacterium]|nr:class I tRNA ligase family protein [Acidobacteriota bacterium]
GVPIAVFVRKADGEVLIDPAVNARIFDTFVEEGADAWFQEGAAARFLGNEYDPEEWEKVDDILDVWFESGSSWNAVMRQRGLGYPVDLYLEGSDQHRGWFQTSLLPALGATGQPPFKSVLTHGFMVDKEGKKMSKSLGNALEVDALLRDFGADVCRWWVSSLAFENDIKVDLEFFEVSGESYRKVRNTLRFLLSNLSDFDPAADSGEPAGPFSLDAWA